MYRGSDTEKSIGPTQFVSIWYEQMDREIIEKRYM